MFCVWPGYFKAMTIRVLQGRSFDETDRDGTQPVAILSQMSAERYFDRVDNVVGRTITIQDSVRGDRTVTIGRFHVRGRESGAESESPWGAVADFKDGRAIRHPQLPQRRGGPRSRRAVGVGAQLRPTVPCETGERRGDCGSTGMDAVAPPLAGCWPADK